MSLLQEEEAALLALLLSFPSELNESVNLRQETSMSLESRIFPSCFMSN